MVNNNLDVGFFGGETGCKVNIANCVISAITRMTKRIKMLKNGTYQKKNKKIYETNKKVKVRVSVVSPCFSISVKYS